MDIEKLRMTAGHAARIEPGDYTATCVAVHPPIEFNQYERMSQRIDFAIEGDGTVLKKYCNLGPSKSPWKVVTPKSEYYKVWTAGMGRKPKPGELITLDAIVGVRFRVSVLDKAHKEHGYTYSVVGKVHPVSQQAEQPEYTQCLTVSVSQELNVSRTQLLNSSVSQPLSHSTTQDVVLEMEKTNRAVHSATQDVAHAETQPLRHSATQDDTPEIYMFSADGGPIKLQVAPYESQYSGLDVHRIMAEIVGEIGTQSPSPQQIVNELRRRLDAARRANGVAA